MGFLGRRARGGYCATLIFSILFVLILDNLCVSTSCTQVRFQVD
jgi:hypothetical protein